MISDRDLDKLRRNIDYLDATQKARVLELLDERAHINEMQEAREHFIPFVKRMWPDVILGAHHTLMAEAYEKVLNGDIKRLIINIAPRHSKSEMTSWLLPLWFLGRSPRAKIMQCMNTQDLAAGFGRRVRNIISKEAIATDNKGFSPYHEIFPDMDLAKDSGAANHWHDIAGGEYYAVGTGGKIAGRGADLLIIDDPHALEINTPIPTPKGFIALGKLQIGDEVYGPDGKPTRVVAKSEVYRNRPLYEVTTNDDETILADARHLWSYRRGTNVKLSFTTGTTEMLAGWDKPNKPIIPRHAPVEYPRANLLIDPYVLGYWLGNGTATLGRVTCHLDDIAYIRSQYEAAGYETTDQTDPNNFGVLGLRAQLMELGLYDNKHVPEQYLTASIEQRLALLQGLMDSDGDITVAGQCSFNNTNISLVEGVRQLVQSLGARCSPARFIPPGTSGYKATTANYRTCFKLQDAARIPRKRERAYTPTDKRGRSITVTDARRRGDVQCITVEREDGLFLAGRGYVVTHNSEQEAKLAANNPEIFDSVYDWYVYGPRQRLQPNGKIIVVQTRWNKRDLTGRLLQKMQEDNSAVADEWHQIEFPAILDEGEPTERALWPGYWPLETQQATRAALPVSAWQAQYQQQPTSEEGAIFKKENWRIWGSDKEPHPGPNHAQAWRDQEPPACEYVIHSWDTAIKKNERADYSAMTSWGVFQAEDPASGKVVNNIILLSAYKARMEFPELKRKVKQFFDEDMPDTLLIEDKGSGSSLIQELRSMGIAVENFSYGRGSVKVSNDKVARANIVSDVFASKFVWRPERRWAEEVVTEMADFPAGLHDDYVDSAVQAMIRFRAGGLIRTANDEPEDDDEERPVRRKRYY